MKTNKLNIQKFDLNNLVGVESISDQHAEIISAGEGRSEIAEEFVNTVLTTRGVPFDVFRLAGGLAMDLADNGSIDRLAAARQSS